MLYFVRRKVLKEDKAPVDTLYGEYKVCNCLLLSVKFFRKFGND